MIDERVLLSKANKLTGEHEHYCPKLDGRMGWRGCAGCDYLVRVERKPRSHVVRCSYPADWGLRVVKPSKAYGPNELPKAMADIFAVDGRWAIAERKLDGVRAIFHFTKDGVRVTTRRRTREGLFNEITDRFPQFSELVVPGELVGLVLDGELYLEDLGGVDFGGRHYEQLGWVSALVRAYPEVSRRMQESGGWVSGWLFDVIYDAGGVPMANIPYGVRRGRLEELAGVLSGLSPYFKLVEGYEARSEGVRRALFQRFVDEGYEGMVLKNVVAVYGERYGILKVKTRLFIDGVIIGWERGTLGSVYEGTVGVIRVAVRDQLSGELREVARVVPGDDQVREWLRGQLWDLGVEEIIDLGLVVEVRGQYWTEGCRLRHPVVVRYRDDKTINDITVVNFPELGCD